MIFGLENYNFDLLKGLFIEINGSHSTCFGKKKIPNIARFL
jgi:hypothetical protein